MLEAWLFAITILPIYDQINYLNNIKKLPKLSSVREAPIKADYEPKERYLIYFLWRNFYYKALAEYYNKSDWS
jgi:hypothetical protein